MQVGDGCVVGTRVELSDSKLEGNTIVYSIEGLCHRRIMEVDDLDSFKSNHDRYVASILDKNSDSFIAKFHQLVTK